jgi:hypothetical protein
MEIDAVVPSFRASKPSRNDRLLRRVARQLARQWLGVTALIVALSGGVALGHSEPAATTGTTFHTVQMGDLAGGGCPGIVKRAYNVDAANYNATAFGRDSNGFVHLRGLLIVCSLDYPNSHKVFTLPLGFRPARTEEFAPGSTFYGQMLPVQVLPDGNVLVWNFNQLVSGGYASLDGLTFRCGPSGANGCP